MGRIAPTLIGSPEGALAADELACDDDTAADELGCADDDTAADELDCDDDATADELACDDDDDAAGLVGCGTAVGAVVGVALAQPDKTSARVRTNTIQRINDLNVRMKTPPLPFLKIFWCGHAKRSLGSE